MTSLTMSAGSNESRRPRRRSASVGRPSAAAPLQPLAEPLRQLAAQPLLQVLDADAAAVLQGDAQHRLLRAAGPQVDGVDRVARRDHADVADGDVDVVAARPPRSMTSSACWAISSVCSMRVPVGARSRSWNWPGVDAGKISVPELPADQPDHQAARRRGRPATSSPAAAARRARTQPAVARRGAAIEGEPRRAAARRAGVVVPQQPDRQHRHERAGQQVRRRPSRSRRPATAARTAPGPPPA